MDDTHPETLDAILRRRAAELPEHVAYRFLADGETETETLTYGALAARARAIAARLLALAAPCQPVLLLYETGLEPLAGFFGCLAAGMLAVPVAPPRTRQPLSALAAVAADAGAGLVLTTRALLARYAADPAVALAGLRWLASDSISADDPAAAAWQPPATTADEVAALLYTSGSTSTPKGVMLSHRVLWGPPVQVPEGLDPDWTLNGIDWMPLYHLAGLNFALVPLRVGAATQVLLPAEVVLAQPLVWLRAISRYRALQAGGPNFLFQLAVNGVSPAERAGLDFSLWLFAPLLSEPIRAETLEQFAAAYEPAGFQPWAFLPNYGLSEQPGITVRAGMRLPRISAFDRAALARNRVRPAAAEAPALRLVSNGPLAAEVTVRVVNPATLALCAPDEVGELWVAGPVRASGYWRRPEETAATFQARLPGSAEGPFVRTGDLGFIYEGELYICGRLKDMLIIRGHNYYAEDIEAAAAGAHPDLGGAAAAFGVPAPGGGEQAVLYHEVRPECAAPDVEAVSAAIRRAVAGALQLALAAVVLVPAGGLPRTGPGKIPRHAVRAAYLAEMAAAEPAAESAAQP